MERKLDRAQESTKGQSVTVTVPTIILNTGPEEKGGQSGLSLSRSVGDLEMAVAESESLQDTCRRDGISSKLSGSLSDGLHETESRSAIGLYCSPRLPRRSMQSDINVMHNQYGGNHETLTVSNLNSLDPGSRVGSTVSLNSEYTSRSVGLISNDSFSECSQTIHTVPLEGSIQKHSVLKRFYSSPEKDNDMNSEEGYVQRNSISMGNVRGENEHSVSFEIPCDTKDDRVHDFGIYDCDLDDLTKRTSSGPDDGRQKKNLVTAVTGDSTLRQGRIQKWLNEINMPDRHSHT